MRSTNENRLERITITESDGLSGKGPGPLSLHPVLQAISIAPKAKTTALEELQLNLRAGPKRFFFFQMILIFFVHSLNVVNYSDEQFFFIVLKCTFTILTRFKLAVQCH